MGAVRQWLTGVVAVAVLLYLVRCLVPKSAVRRAADFTGGLVLMAALLQPLADISPRALRQDMERWQREAERQQTQMESDGEKELAAVIARRTEAYISDKADALGLTVAVRVETAPSGGVAVPWAVTVRGPYSEALSAMMERDLDIPRERQVWYD